MSKGSYFLVYFLGDFTLDDAEKALRATSMKVARDGDAVMVKEKQSPTFQIELNADASVLAEAREIAEEHELPVLAECKKRYEIHFDDLEEALMEYTTLSEVQMTLLDLTKGWIELAWNGELFGPEG